MNLYAKIEAILFWKAEPITLKELAKIFAISTEEVKSALLELEQNLLSRGLTLVWKDEEVTLRTSPEIAGLIEQMTKDELTKDLGRAGLETLSIILYQGPISRRDIDYIRGVNSNFILRNLLVRGLVERVDDPKNGRSFAYRPTFELLSFMGISRVEDLPEYHSVRQEVEAFKTAEKENVKQDVMEAGGSDSSVSNNV